MARLDITSDVFLQYFVWQGMSDKIKNVFMTVANTSNPNLNEILNTSFEVLSRLKEQVSHEKPNLALDEGRNTKTTSLSTSVSLEKGGYAKGKKCSLCFYLKLPVYDHYVYKCVNFKTPESKLNKIKEVGGCVKWG